VGEIREISEKRDAVEKALGGVIVGVCMDEDREKARTFLEGAGNPFPSAFNGGFWNGTVARAYGVRAIPHGVLVGPDGRILRKEVLPDWLLQEPEAEGP